MGKARTMGFRPCRMPVTAPTGGICWQNGAMSPRIAPLSGPAIAFAHRGAKAHARENTLEAFALALQMGATGLESDVWVSRDGQAILDHDGVVGPRIRRRPISSVDRADLPEHMPTIRELYLTCGPEFELSLDIKDPEAATPTAQTILTLEQELGRSIADRVWFCHPDLEKVAEWREVWPQFKMVHSTRLKHLNDGPERHAETLSSAGIHCLNMRQPDWTGGLVTLFHRFEVHCFAWDVNLDRLLAEIFDAGVDGLYSDHVDRMMAAHEAAYRFT